VSLVASRGCPYRCDFCSVHRMFGRNPDYRDPGSVLDEIRRNYVQRAVRLFNFEDDNLSIDRRWFLDFLTAVAEDSALRDIELTAMNGLCYPTLDEELLGAMKRAGFRQLNLSLISQSGTLRAAHGRPAGSADFTALVRAAQGLGFFMTVYVILGLPGQAYDEVKNTLEYLLGLGVLVGPSVFYLPAGSELYEKIQISPEIKGNWDTYRSSAFAVETKDISRTQLLELFLYVREKNLATKEGRGHPH
jgi:anaerobic magnesium-protoporphyrin IX monomethyl ester cyclase